MTNLIASVVVAIVTNVVEEGPKTLVSIPNASGPSGMMHVVFNGRWERDPNATEKWITTEVKEISTLRFRWKGNREVVTEKLISSQTVTQKLEWITK